MLRTNTDRVRQCDETNLSPGLLSVSFLNSLEDTSVNHLAVTFVGDADLTFSGALFDGDGDYVSVADFDYETGGAFSISFWMTKTECTDGIYEYLYSHMTSTGADAWSTSSLNVYLGCEASGGGFSTVGGTIIRFNVMDTTGAPTGNPMFDFPVHEAGDFDSVTNVWVHVVWGVSTTSMKTWDDGMSISDTGCTASTVGTDGCPYHFYGGAADASNVAYPRPSALSSPLAGFDFGAGDIHLGSRADHEANLHFRGKIALVSVYDYVVTNTQAMCLFRGGDAALPDP